jgi:uncharacterized protein (TIGR03437 family)
VTLDNNGHGSLSLPSSILPPLGAGTYTISAAYDGDANYQSGTAGPATLVVAKVDTKVTVAPSTAGLNQAVSLTAKVSLANWSSAAATGAVDFTNGGNVIAGCMAVPLRNGVAVCTTTFSQIGIVTIGAVYKGDANTNPSTASMQLAVTKSAVSAYLAAAPASPVYGDTVTLDTLVQGPQGGMAPTGTVTFTDGPTILGVVALGSNGRALLAAPKGSLGALSAGTHNIAATYSGDDNYQTSPGANLTLTIGKVGTFVTVASSTAQLDQPVTLKANVTLANWASVPVGGTVDFSNGSAPISGCTGVKAQNGVAACATNFPQTGQMTVGAAYNGDSNTLPGTGLIQLNVGKAAASAYLAIAPSAPVYGEQTAIDALILGAQGLAAPSGAITFSEGTTVFGTFPLDSNGRASLSAPAQGIPVFPAGPHTVTATYNGDANYVPAAPVALNLLVAKANTTTLLSASAGGLVANVNVQPPGGGVPTGAVQFSSGGNLFATVPLIAHGSGFVASVATGSQAGAITATYLGGANFNGSVSTAATLAAPQAQITLTASSEAAVFGQTVVFTAQLVASGNVSPVGSLQLLDGSKVIGSATLSNGTAAVAISSLSVGSHQISATLPGDSTSNSVNSNSIAISINRAQTATELTPVGTTLTVAVTPVAPGSGSPAGIASLVDPSTSRVLSTATVTSGSAIFPRPSDHGVVVLYAGDGNFMGSTSAPFVPLTAASAASYAAGTIAPDELVTLFGHELADAPTSATAQPAAALGGATVRITDSTGVNQPAGLLFVSPMQASVLIAPDTAYGPATIAFASSSGVTVSSTITVSPVAPGLFTAGSDGSGAPAGQALRVHADGSTASLQDLATYDTAGGQWVPHPIPRGAPDDVVYLTLYGTGLRHFTSPPLCTIGSQSIPVDYAGAQGTFAGLDQINVRLPAGLTGTGTLNLTLTVDGIASNTVILSVQ